MAFNILLVVLLAAVPAALCQPKNPGGNPIGGPKGKATATNYGGPYDGMNALGGSFGLSEGGCGYGNINDASKYPFRQALAFDPKSPAIAGLPSFGCGSCWKVTNTANGKSVTALNTDICPGCLRGAANAVDIHFSTWSMIGTAHSNGGGQLNVEVQRVNCNPPGNAQLMIKDARGAFGWFRAYAFGLRGKGTVKGMSITCSNTINFNNKPQGAKTVVMKNSYGNVYETPQIPLYAKGSTCFVEVTNEDGAKIKTAPFNVESYKGQHGDGKAVPFAGNFPLVGGGPGRRLLADGEEAIGEPFEASLSVRDMPELA